MYSRSPVASPRLIAFAAAVTLALGCGRVSDGPEPTLYMPPVERVALVDGFSEPMELTLAVELMGLRRPPIDETVDAQIAAMSAHVRRHGRGLGSADRIEVETHATADETTLHAHRLAIAASQLLSYLPTDASPEILARTSVAALAKSLGPDGEVQLGDLFATPGAADISAGVFHRIAVLRLRHLGADMNDRVQSVFNQWSAAAETPRALVLDLSECFDGGPQTATTLVNALAPGRVALQVAFRDRRSQKIERQTWRGEAGWGQTAFSKLPVFVLTSGRTAGAAEAVVHALRAHRLAHVIGHNTAGTGRIISWHALPWNAWFGFTIADLYGIDGAPLRKSPVIVDTCPARDGLAALPERSMESYERLCVDPRTPALEDVLDHVDRLLAARANPAAP